MRGVSMPSKAPGERLGIPLARSGECLEWGSVAHAWLHTVKHTKSLNFDLNIRVLGGFCGSVRVKHEGVPRVLLLFESCRLSTRNPLFQ